MRSVSLKTKIRQHRGEGRGADYRPWIFVRELSSTGTCAEIRNWKTGRTMQLLSQGELYLFYILNWDPRVVDIREQFPLDIEETKRISKEMGVKHPSVAGNPMTTDLLVTLNDGREIAYSVKASRKDLKPRSLEILAVEKAYWNSKGIEWYLKCKDEMNLTYVRNIREVMAYYYPEDVHPGDRLGKLKHDIATGTIIVEMKNEPLDYRRLANGLGY